MLSVCHPGIRFRSLIGVAEGSQAHRGHEEMRRWWAGAEEVFAERWMEIDELATRGEWAVVRGAGHGVGRASGAEVRWPYVGVARGVDGFLTEWRFFADDADARAFMGDG